ncbi:MAG: hypothetical protein M5U14_13830 [Acidimicrobiia bacterium]|nr:hypothetical protein [Acidimicrobiia bacterium]
MPVPDAATRIPATIRGYRLVACDGGVFCFGDAPFLGSLPERGVDVDDVVALVPCSGRDGYWIVQACGRVHAFGDAPPLGSAPAGLVGATPAPGGCGP